MSRPQQYGVTTDVDGNVLIGDPDSPDLQINTDGSVTVRNGLTVTAGGMTVSAGTSTVSAATTFGAAVTFSTNTKLQFRDTGIYLNSGADGKLTISADGSGTDDITISGTITLDDDLITPTTKKVQFRDSGIYINSGADGKLTISADGSSTDDITLSGTITLDDDLITPTTKKIQFRDAGLYINSGADGKLTISADGSGTDDITLDGTVTVGDDLALTGVITQSKTVTGTALGTVRGVHGQVTASTASIASGNIVGTRGLCTLSGTITAGGAFLYGAQGKLVVTGTMNHADARLCAMLAQLDISAGIYTAGQMSALWVDAGASAASAHDGGGQFNMIRISNTTIAVPNAHVFVYGPASYLFDFASAGDWVAANTHAIDSHTLSYILKVKDPAGAAGYIPVLAAVPA